MQSSFEAYDVRPEVRASAEPPKKMDLKTARRQIVNPYLPGEIFYNSWGYDQTNVDFYIVTRVSRKCAWIRPIESCQTEKGPGAMCGHTVPIIPRDPLHLHSGLKPEQRKTLQIYIDADGNPSPPYISMDHGSLQPWNGEPIGYSNDH